MSEFKFACPVCQQHITADSAASGSQIECPTCFQKIIVPQAPTAESQKFILSATKAGPPRTSNTEMVAKLAARPNRGRNLAPWLAGALLLVAASVAAFLIHKHRTARLEAQRSQNRTNQSAVSNSPGQPGTTNGFVSPYPVPANISWSLEVSNAVIPEARVAGRLNGQGFGLDVSTFQNGTLALRQGKGWPPDLGVTIVFPAKKIEDFSGKTVEVWPDRPPPVPRITLRWKDEQREPRNREYRSGYALKASFGQPNEGKLPGRIFLALPDDQQSFLAGTFTAEIRTNAPGKKPGPKPTRPAKSSATPTNASPAPAVQSTNAPGP